ncbi:hypothetical protein LAV84_28840 [Rhizobium sp. VS19-DR104.2]|uniref:hypothetical protein n=1 Tax=unclassified Rhizobium TaxID=2613769 RepID=UPI001CC55D4A|nr:MULTISPECIES: hypothetical protein [unclassified Rhizobium]MBZ5763526.1 hypothetical protein [Rhizobium sp. VS19-DR96]MBZ5769409.1 hypothetical protein [Rhizobium sp. VS19-DR129.2]MBZ5776970.1 hypothetical protein [Rhizobium sp. VS19-DRK62.2]MBZ5788086.1 hypothetical protein [Rhizobium sp. VS19-DR121]MBZ5805535.1 hypothetical protein [Rhizobium sp. VS19-DR181]
MAIKIQQLQTITTFTAKGKDRAARRLLAQDILGKRSQAFYSFAHVRDPTRKIDPNAGPRPDHAASTARISWVRAAVSTALPKRRVRPQLNRSSIIPERLSLSS